MNLIKHRSGDEWQGLNSKNGVFYFEDVSNNSDYTINILEEIPLFVGFMMNVKINTTNDGPATFSVDNGVTKYPLIKGVNELLDPNDIKKDQIIQIVFDGVQWRMNAYVNKSGDVITGNLEAHVFISNASEGNAPLQVSSQVKVPNLNVDMLNGIKLEDVQSGDAGKVLRITSGEDAIETVSHIGVGGSAHPDASTTVAGFMTGPDKTKLNGIATGAQVNVATNLAQGTRTTTTVPVTSSTGTDATLAAATTSLAGVMTSADKTKLDGIATGAQVNTITSVAGRTGAVVVTKDDVGLPDVVNINVATYGIGFNFPSNVIDFNDIADSQPKSGFYPVMAGAGSANAPLPTKYFYVQQLFYSNGGNVTQIAYPYRVGTEASYMRSRYSGVWTAWVEMYSSVNTPTATTSVDGFMTSTDKTKLDGIATGAQVNVATNLAQGARTTTTVPITSSTGTDATLAAATTSLAGVMTSADKTKLDGIATSANNYAHPSDGGGSLTGLAGAVVVSGLTVNAAGHVTATTTRSLTAANISAEPAFSKNTAFNKNFGSATGTVCQGDDSRLSDARTPTSHTLGSHSDTSGFSNTNPLMDGTVSQGTSDRVSRQDHVHPSDTTRALAARTITAGNGLTGGGDLTANRTVTMGTPTTLDISSANSVTASSHSHKLDLHDFGVLNKYRTNKDANGIFTTITYRRADASLYATSVLSGGTSPEYTTRTEIFYDTNGTTVLATNVYTLSYDVDSLLTSEVLN